MTKITSDDNLIVVAFTKEPYRGACGQTVGADGGGDYSCIFKIVSDEDKEKANEFIEEVKRRGCKNLTVSYTDAYFNQVIIQGAGNEKI